MVAVGKRTLTGMKAICAHVQLSEATVLTLVRDCAFPARKTKDCAGIWISNAEAIDDWSREYVETRD